MPPVMAGNYEFHVEETKQNVMQMSANKQYQLSQIPEIELTHERFQSPNKSNFNQIPENTRSNFPNSQN